MSWVFASGDQNIGASASASVIPVNIQGWFPLRVTGLISLLSKEHFKSLLQHHSSKRSILWYSTFFMVHTHNHRWLLGKTIAVTIQTFAGKEMSLIFNTLARFVIPFLLWSNHLLVSWTQSPSAEMLRPKKRISVTVSTFSPSVCHELMGLDSMKRRLTLAYLIYFLCLITTVWYFNSFLWIASWIFSLVYLPALVSTLMH